MMVIILVPLYQSSLVRVIFVMVNNLVSLYQFAMVREMFMLIKILVFSYQFPFIRVVIMMVNFPLSLSNSLEMLNYFHFFCTMLVCFLHNKILDRKVKVSDPRSILLIIDDVKCKKKI